MGNVSLQLNGADFQKKIWVVCSNKRDVSGRLKEYLNIMSRDVLEAEINSLEEDLVCLR